jgi:hypothetical protein
MHFKRSIRISFLDAVKSTTVKRWQDSAGVVHDPTTWTSTSGRRHLHWWTRCYYVQSLQRETLARTSSISLSIMPRLRWRHARVLSRLDRYGYKRYTAMQCVDGTDLALHLSINEGRVPPVGDNSPTTGAYSRRCSSSSCSNSRPGVRWAAGADVSSWPQQPMQWQSADGLYGISWSSDSQLISTLGLLCALVSREEEDTAAAELIWAQILLTSSPMLLLSYCQHERRSSLMWLHAQRSGLQFDLRQRNFSDFHACSRPTEATWLLFVVIYN